MLPIVVPIVPTAALSPSIALIPAWGVPLRLTFPTIAIAVTRPVATIIVASARAISILARTIVVVIVARKGLLQSIANLAQNAAITRLVKIVQIRLSIHLIHFVLQVRLSDVDTALVRLLYRNPQRLYQIFYSSPPVSGKLHAKVDGHFAQQPLRSKS